MNGYVALSRARVWAINGWAPLAGEVVLQLKTLYRDGATHLVMSPREFLQRLAVRVPGFISFAFMVGLL